jgi:hypothetical protein
MRDCSKWLSDTGYGNYLLEIDKYVFLAAHVSPGILGSEMGFIIGKRRCSYVSRAQGQIWCCDNVVRGGPDSRGSRSEGDSLG